MAGLLPRRALFLAPSAAALLGGATLLVLSRRPPEPVLTSVGGTSALLGHDLPPFTLPGLPGQSGFANTDVAALGHAVLLNFFASWCLPCAQELPVLLRLAKAGVPIWGIGYQDKPEALADFLRRGGNPYQRVGVDAAGTVGGAFGLLGVPESFLAGRHGVVRWHWAGGMSEDVVRNYLEPALWKAGLSKAATL